MNAIYRYQLPITDAPTIPMQVGAQVLSVGSPRDGTDCIDMWALVNDTAIVVDREFRIVGTGNPMPDDCGRFVGTVVTHGGALVWHVFEVAR